QMSAITFDVSAGSGQILFNSGGWTLSNDLSLMDGLIVDGASSGTLGGIISGANSLTKQGAGTLILSGTNNYTGGTTVSGGVLQGNTDSLQGNILNNASVIFDQAVAGSYAGVISGTGSVTKLGAGTLTLDGANTFTGATTITAGTLQLGAAERLSDASAVTVGAGATFDLGGFNETIGSLSGAGSVALGAGTLTAGGDGTSTTFSGAIGGTGGLVKDGAGTLILSGTNNYTGGTTVSAGVLQGNTTSLRGDITNNASLVFDQAADGTYAGAISGTGSVTKLNAGTLTLSGANNYTGGTTITAGTLLGNSTSLRGDITNNAALVFDQAADGTYAGAIGGTGTVTKQNIGTLNFTGNSNYTGATAINAGRLNVNGSLDSVVTVNNGAILGGNGTIGGLVLNNGSTLAPGNSIDTMTVDGAYTQNAGSIFQLEINDGGTTAGVNNDLVNVIGAPGTATLNGGTVDVQAAPGDYAAGTTYTFLTATGGVTGTFDGVMDNLALRDGVLIYNANSVQLQLVRISGSFATIAATDNQAAVGMVLEQAAPTATGDLGLVLDEMLMLSTAGRQNALDQLSGESHASLSGPRTQFATQFLQVAAGRLRPTAGANFAG
ncbi:MAG: autotransporter-associated beta strand repeat-containing protein, partial [Planctomycetes bacterium]|nr:autotransporter-associated beta strand repeat-containing protein [Planctomycetota bacterium]